MTDFAAAGGGVGSAIGALINLAMGDDAGQDQLKEALAAIRGVQDPQFDFTRVDPAQLEIIQKAAPALMQAADPGQAALVEGSPIRADQLAALGALQQIQNEGFTDSERLAVQGINESQAAEGQRATDAVLSDLAARGRLGGGQELVARQLGNQIASQRAGDMGRALAEAALSRRMAAAGGAGNLAGQVRTADEQRAATNADVVNRFKEFAANLQQQRNMFNAGAQTDANFRNTSRAQGVGDTNALNRQSTMESNIGRFNDLQQRLQDFRFRRAAAEGGALGNLAQLDWANQAARQQNIINAGRGIGETAGAVGGFFAGGGFG